MNDAQDEAPTVSQMIELFDKHSNGFTRELGGRIAVEWARQANWRWIERQLLGPEHEVAMK